MNTPHWCSNACYFYGVVRRFSRLAHIVLFVAIALLSSTCSSPSKAKKITIASSANMQYPIAALSEAFTEKTGIECELVISSSGKLTAQIMEGAPYHVFLSADMKYPQTIYDAGLAVEAPLNYASGQLVIWTNYSDVDPQLDQLPSDAINHIAVANQVTAPYGKAAMEVLANAGLLESVRDKLVFGESITQTSQFIYSQAADIGFTAKAMVLSPHLKGVGKWQEIDAALHHPIQQGAVLLKTEKATRDRAAAFYNFLRSDEAKAILITFGYR